MLESRLEQIFRYRVRMSTGGMVLKLAPTVKGMPDRLVLLPGGRLYLVELKTNIGRLSPAQVHWHARAAQLGVTVFVLRNELEIIEWIRDRINEVAPKERQSRRKPA